VDRQLAHRRKNAQICFTDPMVERASTAAYRTVANTDVVELGVDLEPDLSAVATSAIGLFHDPFSHRIASGPAITTQQSPDIRTAMKTAALPRSFARPASGWRSNEMRSTVVSIAEFTNSTSTTSIIDNTRTRCSMSLTGSRIETGTRIASARSPSRIAASFRTACRTPAY